MKTNNWASYETETIESRLVVYADKRNVADVFFQKVVLPKLISDRLEELGMKIEKAEVTISFTVYLNKGTR